MDQRAASSIHPNSFDHFYLRCDIQHVFSHSLFSHSCNVKQWNHIRTWTYRRSSPHQTAAWPTPSSGENQDICFYLILQSRCVPNATSICVTKKKISFPLGFVWWTFPQLKVYALNCNIIELLSVKLYFCMFACNMICNMLTCLAQPPSVTSEIRYN